MLHVMDNMEVSGVFYVKVSMFTHLEKSKIALQTVNTLVMMTLTVQHDMIVCVSFIQYHGDYLSQTSAQILSFKLHPINIQQLHHFCGRTPQMICVIKLATSDRLITNCGALGNPCNLQPYSVGFILSITIMLAAIYSILT
jgi:hypothetical protein